MECDMTTTSNDVLTWGGKPPVQAACVVCGATSLKRHVVTVATPVDRTGELHFYGCETCGSVFPHPFVQPDYDDDYGYKDYTRFYCELGAGIDFMIRPIEIANRYTPIRSFLDAGCGFGFTLDFAKRMLGAKTVGFDPSAYAREGARILDVDIRHEYLSETSELDVERVDMIFCSEVIEHVDAPDAFVRMLRSKLSPDGVIALTTPAAAWVSPNKSFSVTLECLTPGFHRQIFSAQALAELLHKAGFRHVKVLEDRHRLIAFASETRDVSDIHDVASVSRTTYRRYLAALVQAFREGGGPVYSGALYRAFKEAVNAGELATARSLASELQELLFGLLGRDVTSQEGLRAIVQNFRAERRLLGLKPYHLPGSMFYLGMAFLNFEKDPQRAALLFEAATEVTRHMLSRPNALLSEPASLYWLMVYHAGLANLVAGNRERSLEWFQQIFEAAVALPDDLVQTELLPRDIARAKLQAGIAHLQLGRHEQATALLAEAAAAPAEALSRDERSAAASLAETARAAIRGEAVPEEAVAKTAALAARGHSPFVALMRRIMPEPLRPAARRLWYMMRR
jgi:2-polyprenyl-3-methyl-5-hydroxy-6-metoxy-1,4-benzoquinol methylase/tetratricopeptide (TPR) repeat protein